MLLDGMGELTESEMVPEMAIFPSWVSTGLGSATPFVIVTRSAPTFVLLVVIPFRNVNAVGYLETRLHMLLDKPVDTVFAVRVRCIGAGHAVSLPFKYALTTTPPAHRCLTR